MGPALMRIAAAVGVPVAAGVRGDRTRVDRMRVAHAVPAVDARRRSAVRCSVTAPTFRAALCP